MIMNTIHHIVIICSDKEAALHFYHDLLGFPIIRESYRPEWDGWKIKGRQGRGQVVRPEGRFT